MPAKLEYIRKSEMTFGNAQAKNRSARSRRRREFFWFTVFTFSTASTAEGAGV